MKGLGTGIGWRPEIADAVERLPGVDWVEVVAENVCPGHVPDSLTRLRERGVTVVPHGVSLGLGGADRPDEARLARLAATATALDAPLVTEHVAFVRAGGPRTASPALEAGHLLPVPRTREALDVLCENVRIAQEALPVPLALENVAALFAWPGDELTEGRFLAELVERTGVRLLIDVANLHTNRVNRGDDPAEALAELPVEAVAYVHVAGGVERDGVWHDTHAHPVPPQVLDLLSQLATRAVPPGVLLERDDDFPPEEELAAELAAIRERVAAAGPSRHPAAAPALVPAAAPATASAPAPAPAPALVGVPDQGEARDRATAPAGARAPDRTDAPGEVWEAAPEAARERLALGQAALLSALVAGTPAPEGFDGARLRQQALALARKRAGVVARLAPELPVLLGEGYREAFVAYARTRPMAGGYRRDALDFARHLLDSGRPGDVRVRRRLYRWWAERAGRRPAGRAARLVHAARAALVV
ncbi:DUF692 domain-containing protein [Streptomyces fradiae]|uniref:DUF692 domain-containing protein n=1 Tax=Streptomyces fradiae TaxID=1906 RepID=UPI0029429EDB|nr:DUF692 domain-containing protein [Streptomyces fradiae]WOI61780.1 DUF692 domain-containing protein [Streptomyces fradiae]